MTNDKIVILEKCPNYDEIVNFPILEDDQISKEIIDQYRDFIFNENEDITKIEMLDKILKEYIMMGKFYQMVQKKYYQSLNDENGLEYVLDFYNHLKLIYEKYEEELLKEKPGTRWF